MDNKLKKLFTDDTVRLKNNQINIDDVISKIIASTNPRTYKNNLCNKIGVSKDSIYVSQNKFIEIIGKTNKVKVRKYIKYFDDIEHGSYDEDMDCPIDIQTYDVNLFENKLVPRKNMLLDPTKYTYVVDSENTAWFRADKLVDTLGFDSIDSLLYEMTDDDVDNKLKLSHIKNKSDHSTKFGPKDTMYIREQSLYEYMGRCRTNNPIVKQFKRWLYGELVPEIRRKGGNLSAPIIFDYDINDYYKKSVVYLLYITGDLYKFGITDCLNDRLGTLKRELNYQHVVKLYQVKSYRDAKTVESKIKNQIKSMDIATIHKAKTEIIKVNDKFTINTIIGMVDKYVAELAIESRK
jgi:prophage antirepressor-like protein